MPRVSIIITNHNGQALLAANLPAVLEYSAGAAEIEFIVADDASTDDSCGLLARDFPQVRLVALTRNAGFGAATNVGVAQARGDLVVLLNTDMQPQPNYLAPLIAELQQPRCFAVMAQQIVPEETRIVYRKRTIGGFGRGFFRHKFATDLAPDQTQDGQPAFYAPGGGSAFLREAFLQLGGFDALFAPFYWEDVDLSVRAWRRGWQVRYAPSSRILHPWSKTIYRDNPVNCIRVITACNACLMVWKNALDAVLWRSHWLSLGPWLLLNTARGNTTAVRGLRAALRNWNSAKRAREREYGAKVLIDAEWMTRASGRQRIS